MQSQSPKPYHSFEDDCSLEDCVKAIEGMKSPPWGGSTRQRVEIRCVSETKVRFSVKRFGFIWNGFQNYRGSYTKLGHVFGYAETIGGNRTAVHFKSASPTGHLFLVGMIPVVFVSTICITLAITGNLEVLLCGLFFGTFVIGGFWIYALTILTRFEEFFGEFEGELKRKLNK